jgi:hypothetical protein
MLAIKMRRCVASRSSRRLWDRNQAVTSPAFQLRDLPPSATGVRTFKGGPPALRYRSSSADDAPHADEPPEVFLQLVEIVVLGWVND